MAIFERLDGRYIRCCLAIVYTLGAPVLSCYLRDLVTIIIPREGSLRRRGLDLHASGPGLECVFHLRNIQSSNKK